MFTWVATFRDGTVLREDDPTSALCSHEYDSHDHGLACIKDKDVQSLGWFLDERLFAGVLIPAGAEPFLIRRNTINLRTGPKSMLWSAGWKRGEQSEYVTIYPDYSVICSETEP